MALRNITLSAEADRIDAARRRAREQGTTLNAAFRDWLQTYTATDTAPTAYEQLMRRLGGVHTDRPFERS